MLSQLVSNFGVYSSCSKAFLYTGTYTFPHSPYSKAFPYTGTFTFPLLALRRWPPSLTNLQTPLPSQLCLWMLWKDTNWTLFPPEVTLRLRSRPLAWTYVEAPVTAVCTALCLKINSKLQFPLLLVIQSKLVLALTPSNFGFQHLLLCHLFSLTPGLFLAPASQTSEGKS